MAGRDVERDVAQAIRVEAPTKGEEHLPRGGDHHADHQRAPLFRAHAAEQPGEQRPQAKADRGLHGKARLRIRNQAESQRGDDEQRAHGPP